MEHVSWLFEEAWEQRRRRRRAILWLGTAVVAALTLVEAFSLGGGRSVPNPSAGIQRPAKTITEPPSVVLSRSPYMGVHCHLSHSGPCDGVGLAIWLKQPAQSVTATIDGRVLTMSFRDQLISSRRPRTEFIGYLRRAGLASNATVRLRIDYGSARVVATYLRVPLMAGWG